LIATIVALTVAFWCQSALAQRSTQDLAAAAQNPIAAMYSLVGREQGATE
jgi:hypothetical protein